MLSARRTSMSEIAFASVSAMARALAVECGSQSEFLQVLARRAHRLHAFVHCRRLVVEDLEHLVALRVAQIEVAQHAMHAHAVGGHLSRPVFGLRQGAGAQAESEAAGDEESADMRVAVTGHKASWFDRHTLRDAAIKRRKPWVKLGKDRTSQRSHRYHSAP